MTEKDSRSPAPYGEAEAPRDCKHGRLARKCEICDLEDMEQILFHGGIIEVAVRNPSVSEYMRHWEGRAEKAERELELCRAVTSLCCERKAAPSETGATDLGGLDPVDNLLGVIADIKAGQANAVDVETCERVVGQIQTLQRELAEAKAERDRVVATHKGLMQAVEARAEAAERAAAAYKWGYEYAKDRLKSIGRDGWANDCDSEIEARKGGQ